VLNYTFCNSTPIISVKIDFVSIFHLIEIVLEVEQKKQPTDIKLLQEMEVTVTQDSHEVKSENADTKSFILY